MSARPLILHTYAEWTALSALRSGAPIKSRQQVYRAMRKIDFTPVTNPALGPIDGSEFDAWHSAAVARLGTIERRLKDQVGWSAKIINVYLKTLSYVGDQGRPNLRLCLHPPIDAGLWQGVKNKFPRRADILDNTHCVTTIAAIKTLEIYSQIIGGLRMAAKELGCCLIEVEQLWEGTVIADEA